jgi:purine-binding chemotaxis protein CheW
MIVPCPLPDAALLFGKGPMTTMETAATKQYLTFRLGDEVFALDIARVREVLDFTTVTRVPRMPEFLRGVINLRGSVVPVADLRLKLGMTRTERSANTCVIIAEISVDGETTLLGALADSVQEVLAMDANEILPAPRIGTRLNTECIQGMGNRNDRAIIVLEIDKVFSAGELASAQTAPAGQTN